MTVVKCSQFVQWFVSDSAEEVQTERGRNVQRLQAESRGSVREEDGECLLGVHKKLWGIISVLEAILNVTNERHGDSFLKLIQRCVKVEDFHNLLCGEGSAEGTDSLSILGGFLLDLQQLGSLDDGLQSGCGFTVVQVISSEPLLHLTCVVPELHAGAPGADVFSEQQVVEGDSIDTVKELPDDLADDLRVETMVTHDAVKLSDLPDEGLQGVAAGTGAVIVHARGAVPVAHGLHPSQARDAFTLKHG